MVLGQQLNEFQEYETSLRGDMTVCTPSEMQSVLDVTIQRGEMTASPPQADDRAGAPPGDLQDEGGGLSTSIIFLSSPSPNVAAAAHC